MGFHDQVCRSAEAAVRRWELAGFMVPDPAEILFARRLLATNEQLKLLQAEPRLPRGITEREEATIQAALTFWKSYLHAPEAIPWHKVVAERDGKLRALNSDEIDLLYARLSSYWRNDPITSSWLKEIGGQPNNTGDGDWSFLVTTPQGFNPIELIIESSDGLVTLVQGNENDHVCLTGRRYTTRGEFLDLVGILGEIVKPEV